MHISPRWRRWPSSSCRHQPVSRALTRCGTDPGLWQDGEMSEHSGYPGAPPGWYDDPAGGPGQRWWDGYAWTESTVLPQQAPPPPSWVGAAPPRQPPAQIAPWAAASERLNTLAATQAVDDEQRMVGWARFAVAMPGVYFLVSLLLQRANTSQLLSAGHQLRIDWDKAQAGQPTPAYHAAPSSWAPIGAARPGTHDRRRDHRLRMAAQGGDGSERRSTFRRGIHRRGAWVVGSCRSSTCGCPTARCGPASRRGIRTGRGCCSGGWS